MPAIDYHDGRYVNTCTRNHIDANGALGSTVDSEICQMPNQNHADRALMKRVPGVIIEKRQAEFAPPVLAVIATVAAITLSIIWVEIDDPVRGTDVDFLLKFD